MYDKYYVVKWRKDGEEIQSVSFSEEDHASVEELIYGLVRSQGIKEIWKETVEYWSDK